MKPSEVSRAVEKRIRRQIRKSLPIERSVPDLEDVLEKFFNETHRLSREPYLEAVPAYLPGKTLQELANDKVIHQRTAKIFACYFTGDKDADPANIPLHAHQVAAVVEVCQNGKNLVVCTGTGSGKTEAFLIPLVDMLIREQEAREGNHSPGVRAMILYPMNALVNDQIRRLRKLLYWDSSITFGKYTGETAHNDLLEGDLLKNVETQLQELVNSQHAQYAGLGFDDEARLTNEVATRTRWQTTPADILVTNYSMLERLLLQPNTSVLFGPHWKYIVLDEAHCYSGALGTEISWLVRRVKRRAVASDANGKQMRFLATSATLIDDPEMSDAVKAERIRERFASRLFPALADTFAVQLGEPANHPTNADIHAGRDVGFYVGLLEANFTQEQGEKLIDASKQWLGRRSWQNRLKMGLATVLNDDGKAALGDLLVVLDEGHAAAQVWSGNDGISFAHTLPDEKGILVPDHPNLIDLMMKVLLEGIGPLTSHRAWRDWMHDPTDSAPSSIPDDDIGPPNRRRRNPRGNHLHLLDAWSNPLETWSRQALEWFLSVSCRLAASTDVEVELGAIAVTLSDNCRQALYSVKTAIEQAIQNDDALQIRLDTRWAEELKINPTGDFQNTLADALRNDPKLAALRTILANVTMPKQVENAAAATVARNVFEGEENNQDGLDALISLGTLAKDRGKRTPLIDVRYHQLVRGVTAPGLRLGSDNGATTVTLLAEASDDSLTLGLCRNCGQPFALGYWDKSSLDGAGPFQLSPTPEAGKKFLHAFAWVRGILPDDVDGLHKSDRTDLWFTPTTNQIFQTLQAPPDSIHLCAHVAPAGNDFPEFIKQCPTCGGKQQSRSGTRYGLVTPYESGDAINVTAMEELARQSGASDDPTVKKLPGEGRKLLVFSDSRSGSAGLACDFQEYFAETTMGRLVGEAAKQAAIPLDPTNEQVLAAIPSNLHFSVLDDHHFMEGMRANWLKDNPQVPTFGRVSAALSRLFQENNLGCLLSVAEVNTDQNGNDTPVGELNLEKAAQWRLLHAILKKGRHSLRKRQIIRLTAASLEHLDGNAVGCPNLNRAQFKIVLEEILSWLASNVEVAMPQGLPTEQIQRYKNRITLNGVNGTLRWHSDNVGSSMNRLLRELIAIETSYWFDDARARMRQVSGPVRHQLSERVAVLNEEEFRAITSKVVSAKNINEWVGVLPPDVTDGAKFSDQTAVLGKLREYFVEQAGNWLKLLWDKFTQSEHGKPAILSDLGNQVFQINPEALWIHYHSPGANGGEGKIPVWLEEDLDLEARELIPLRVEEHTAQLAKERGSTYQRAFADGHINILSCSTTFEMGVDLGDLSCVFLNGMPPSVANYRQRAGRAGRRPGSPSYVLSFMGRRDHDRYFWNHPGNLLFAPMEEPKIYLENPVFRARHLRAEAMHDFLKWLNDDNHNRLDDQNATQINHSNGQIVEVPGQKRQRKWTSVGDFFVGLAAGKREKQESIDGGKHPLAWRFTPLVEKLTDWLNERESEIQCYLEELDGIENLPYQVALDLIWQLRNQDNLDQLVSPYSINDVAYAWEYRLLGGPNVPVDSGGGSLRPATLDNQKQDLRRASVQTQATHYFDLEANWIQPFQNHLLHEPLITWLSRLRVLPKYGFPVDVIQLIPNKDDSFGRNVRLERDLRIGLYEYAPEQIVTADKRRYQSEEVMVWANGNLGNAQDNLLERRICSNCHEPDWSSDGTQANRCRYCGESKLETVKLCFPDAFRARKSAPSSSFSAQRGAPLHVHTRAFHPEGVRLPKSRLITKESQSGTITYINQGPRYNGFKTRDNGERFSLCHEIRTDIVGWMLDPSLFGNGKLLAEWSHMLSPNGQANGNGRTRLVAAMKSAMYAILRAIALEKEIEEGEIQGILQPEGLQNGERGFVFFDDTSGGGGAVLDLILTGDPTMDEERVELIGKILRRAISLCTDHCSCGDDGAEINAMPVCKKDWIGLRAGNNAANHRRSASCYDCLRSHRNQRDHEYLDRHDAARLIMEMQGSPTLPNGTYDMNRLLEEAEIPSQFDFMTDGGVFHSQVRKHNAPQNGEWILLRLPNGSFAYGTWFLATRQQADGEPLQFLRLLNGIGLTQPLSVTTSDLATLEIWK